MTFRPRPTAPPLTHCRRGPLSSIQMPRRAAHGDMPAAGRRCNCRAKSRGVQKHRDGPVQARAAGIRWPAEPATRTPRPGEQACGSPSPLHRRPHTVHLRSSTRRRTPQLLPQSVSPSSCGAPRPDRHSSAAIQHIHRYPAPHSHPVVANRSPASAPCCLPPPQRCHHATALIHPTHAFC